MGKFSSAAWANTMILSGMWCTFKNDDANFCVWPLEQKQPTVLMANTKESLLELSLQICNKYTFSRFYICCCRHRNTVYVARRWTMAKSYILLVQLRYSTSYQRSCLNFFTRARIFLKSITLVFFPWHWPIEALGRLRILNQFYIVNGLFWIGISIYPFLSRAYTYSKKPLIWNTYPCFTQNKQHQAF